mmetsp:Transcript_25722/g.85799  ORF Transcript_25722/g.85799 Transcript_25722/m.85799 type:complete len:123 (-) Transcript_25722:54-422(-)
MEEVLDYLGVARCRQCGIRLPLDVAAIEEHCRHCFAGDPEVEEEALAAEEEALAAERALYGKCSQCREELLLSAADTHVCAGGRSSKSSRGRKSGLRSWWPKGSPTKASDRISPPPCPGSPL